MEEVVLKRDAEAVKEARGRRSHHVMRLSRASRLKSGADDDHFTNGFLCLNGLDGDDNFGRIAPLIDR